MIKIELKEYLISRTFLGFNLERQIVVGEGYGPLRIKWRWNYPNWVGLPHHLPWHRTWKWSFARDFGK